MRFVSESCVSEVRVQLTGPSGSLAAAIPGGQPGGVLPHLRLWRIQLLAGVGLSALLSALRPPNP